MYRSTWLSLCSLLVAWHARTTAASAFSCVKEGRFPHPTDCGSYLDCLPTGQGGKLEAREGHCFGFPYSPSERRCVAHDQVPGCTPRALRSSIPIPSLKFHCEGENGGATGCHHCKTAYQCIEGEAYVNVCGGQDTCSEDVRFGGGSCLPYAFGDPATHCLCPKTGLTADTYNSTYFVFCDASGTPPALGMYQCPEGKVFVDDEKECQDSGDSFSEEPSETPSCDGSTDTRVNPNDCSWSYTCLPDGSVKSIPCTRNQYYNEATGLCDDKCAVLGPVGDPGDLCPQVGYNADPTDCTKYHLCTVQDDEPYLTITCPGGTRFDAEANKCVTGLDGCTFDYTQCPGHEDLTC